VTVLLLGGTFEAKAIARQLQATDIPFVYSLAGIVRTPDLDGETFTGGFSQFSDKKDPTEGLVRYIKNRNISAIIDATHPFAANMSATAARVASLCDLPLWRYYRPAWVTKNQRNWQEVDSRETALTLITEYKRPLFTIGLQAYELLTEKTNSQHWIIRSATSPGEEQQHALRHRQDYSHINDIGPFKFDNELTLLQETQADVIICKNSGGQVGLAKLDAAKQVGIPVILLSRPIKVTVEKQFDTIEECIFCCKQWFKKQGSNTNGPKHNGSNL